MIAGHFKIPEVCIYFNHRLLRGNRATKFDASGTSFARRFIRPRPNAPGFEAFVSNKYPALVEVGAEFEPNWDAIRAPPHRLKGFSIRTELSPHVVVLKLSPGMPAVLVRNVLAPPLEGIFAAAQYCEYLRSVIRLHHGNVREWQRAHECRVPRCAA